MLRTTIWITESQNERLKDLAYQEGVTPSELIRRAIDIYLILHGMFGTERFQRLAEFIRTIGE